MKSGIIEYYEPFKRMVPTGPFSGLLFLVLLCSALTSHADETGKSYSLEPFADYGLVYQFTEHVTTYSGGGLAARWTHAPWTISARWRSDEYEITYYGVTNDTLVQLFSNQTLPGPLLTPTRVLERREERELLFGRSVWGEGLTFLAGVRQVRLLNNFSSMNIFGPALKVGACFDWGKKSVLLNTGGVLDKNGTVRNHRDDYALPDGEKTISFYGQLRSMVDWSAMIELQPSAWGRLQFGYEGAVMGFNYGNRYFHGIALKLEY